MTDIKLWISKNWSNVLLWTALGMMGLSLVYHVLAVPLTI